MSQASSDFDTFDDGGLSESGNEGMAEPMAPPPPQYRKQDFSIYSVMLLLSFAFLFTAAIMFFINAGKF